MMKQIKLLTAYAVVGCIVFFGCKRNEIMDGPENKDIITKGYMNYLTDSVDFGLYGYATLGGGTTGGAGADTVTPTTFNQLKFYLETSTPYVIRIAQTFYKDAKGASLNINSNKTILGVDSSAFLNGIGLNISNHSNIIIRNIKISLTGITDTLGLIATGGYVQSGDHGRPQIKVNGGDCIFMTNSSSRIWIDHCELYSIDPSVQSNPDLYDGLLDMNKSVTNVTVSWCYFHDHYKTTLIGSSTTDTFDRKITFHHNYYRNTDSRTPFLLIAGHAHVYNNYFNQVKEYAVDVRQGACARIEDNVFETVRNPVLSYDNSGGQWQIINNLYTGITGQPFPTTSTCTITLPYTHPLDDVSVVKSKVMSYAGTGKI